MHHNKLSLFSAIIIVGLVATSLYYISGGYNTETSRKLYLQYSSLSKKSPVFNWLLLSTAKRMVKFSPDENISYYYLGNAYIENSKFDEGIDAYKKAIDIIEKKMAKYGSGANLIVTLEKGSYVNYLSSLAEAYKKKGDLVKAKETYTKALGVFPNDEKNKNEFEEKINNLSK